MKFAIVVGFQRQERSTPSFENLDLAAWRLKRDFTLPNDWQSSVFDWLWQNRANALENVDDQGGWPDEDDLEAAFSSLGYEKAA